MKPNNVHMFKSEIAGLGKITHVRVNMIPDGGISRLRLYGKLA